MLYHHCNRAYDVAASEAAEDAKVKMKRLIATGRQSGQAMIQHVMSKVPQDAIVKAKAMNFEGAAGGLAVKAGDERWTLHGHALRQLAERAGVPAKYLADLSTSQDVWQRDLAAHMLREHYHHDDDRYLVRAVDGEIRGFLSDTYRRLDTRPILASFIEACQALELVCVEGTVTDTRVAIKAVLPLIFEPVPYEVMLFGVQLKNSDFGAGRLELTPFLLRLWCTNKACLENALAQIHLGKRLPENIRFAEETYQADTQAQALAVRDVMTSVLSPEAIEETQALIIAANEQGVDWRGVSRRLESMLGKAGVEKVRDVYANDRDVDHLPTAAAGGKEGELNLWRLTNAISWVSNSIEDGDQRMDLERLAGEMLLKAKDRRDAIVERRRAAVGADLVDEIISRREGEAGGEQALQA